MDMETLVFLMPVTGVVTSAIVILKLLVQSATQKEVAHARAPLDPRERGQTLVDIQDFLVVLMLMAVL
jgi:hypothetical protein